MNKYPNNINGRYPDEEAGQVPMAVVVRQPKSNLGESEVMDFVAKQVPFIYIYIIYIFIYTLVLINYSFFFKI